MAETRIDERKCPTCSQPVSNHRPKGQQRKTDPCKLSRGKVITLLAKPGLSRFVKPPTRETLEAQLRKLPREKLEAKLEELTT